MMAKTKLEAILWHDGRVIEYRRDSAGLTLVYLECRGDRLELQFTGDLEFYEKGALSYEVIDGEISSHGDGRRLVLKDDDGDVLLSVAFQECRVSIQATNVHIDGRGIKTEQDFHNELASQLDFGPYYGHNLHALWDRLSRDVERPVSLIWHHSDDSRRHLGPIFTSIVAVLDRVAREDETLGLTNRFEYVLQ